MDQSSEKIINSSWQERLRLVGNYLVVAVTHRWVRVVIMLLLVLVLAWFSYTRGYKPLTEDVLLPISVMENNPSLDIKTLQAINTHRAERIRRERPDYTSYSRVLVAPEINK
jgi:hypothetical protein